MCARGAGCSCFPAANSGLARCSRIGRVSGCADAPAQSGAAIGHRALAGCTAPARFRVCPAGPCWMKPSTACSRKYIISGCNLLDFQARVHAGLVVGWIHKPVALLVERSYGKGRFVVSTFRLLRDPPGADPTATVLLDSMLALAMAQGSAASRDRETVINELVDRS